MPTTPQLSLKAPFGIEPAKVVNTPLGLASPLWFAFAGATGVGVAYWWMTRWMRPANLEAAPIAEALAAPAADVIETVAQAQVEVAAELEAALKVEAPAQIEIAPEPVAAVEPIIEAAPVAAVAPEPVLAALAVEVAPEPPAKTPRAKAAPRKAKPVESPPAIEAPEPAPAPVQAAGEPTVEAATSPRKIAKALPVKRRGGVKRVAPGIRTRKHLN